MDKQAWMRAFGENLRRMLTARGYSCQRLSNRTGVEMKMIWRYTVGQVTPNLYTALKLAKGLDCSLEELACVDYFMEDSDERE